MQVAWILMATLCGAVPQNEPEAPRYEFAPQKPADAVEVAAKGKRTLFIISSKSGIGSMTIRLKAGSWPRDVVVRLKGFELLESFAITTERLRVGGELGTSSGGVRAWSGKMPFVFRDAQGKFAAGPSAGTLDVTVEQGKDGLDINLPAHLFVGSREVHIAWIDAFRQ